MTVKTTLNAKDVDNAYLRIKDVVKETPLQFDLYLSQNMTVMYLKREDLQWVRSFKLRGAYNAISVLTSEAKEKVLHAQVLEIMLKVAYTAKALNLKAVIFMPVYTSSKG